LPFPADLLLLKIDDAKLLVTIIHLSGISRQSRHTGGQHELSTNIQSYESPPDPLISTNTIMFVKNIVQYY